MRFDGGDMYTVPLHFGSISLGAFWCACHLYATGDKCRFAGGKCSMYS